MYEYLFESRLVTSIGALLTVVLACGLVGRMRFWWRVLAFSVGPAIACGFYAAALFADANRSIADTAMSLLFEFVALCAFCRLLFLAYRAVHAIDLVAATRALRLTTILYVATIAPTLIGGGFGIFSEGTRIDYLYESSSAKYLTYASLMIGIVQSGLLARRITLHNRLYLLDYAVIGATTVMSIIAGSKGGFLLWMVSILALIDFRAARIRASTVTAALVMVAASVVALAVVVSDFLGLTIPEFFDLAFNRFFITNDARAMAMDLRPLNVDPNTSFLIESFRSLSALFGTGPRDTGLGSLLYTLSFGDVGGAGANASFAALGSYYTAPGYAALPLLAGICATTGLMLVFAALDLWLSSSLARYVAVVLGTLNIALLTQDFLAFQLVLPLTVVTVFGFFVFGKTHGHSFHAPG